MSVFLPTFYEDDSTIVDIIRSYILQVHFNADDTQIYLVSDDGNSSLNKGEDCIRDV